MRRIIRDLESALDPSWDLNIAVTALAKFKAGAFTANQARPIIVDAIQSARGLLAEAENLAGQLIATKGGRS